MVDLLRVARGATIGFLVTPGEGVGGLYFSPSRNRGMLPESNGAPGWDGRSCIFSMQERVEIKCREQRAESRGQRSENREQRAESRGQRAESREQRADCRDLTGDCLRRCGG